MQLSVEEVRNRWHQCWDSKQDELDRIEKSYLWLYEFERHLKRGEEGDEVYRFPETMGYGLRRYNEYLQVLPEARVRGNSDSSVGLQAAIEHEKIMSNLESVKMEAIAKATFMGNGCIFVEPFTWKRKDYEGKEYVQYNGLTAEEVDWRHFFPAPGYTKIHDHTGKNAMPYCFRRRIYHYETFMALGKEKDWKNLNEIKATTWDSANVWGDDEWESPHENEELTGAAEFVTVLEYWDMVNDMLVRYATGGFQLEISDKGIPYAHKQLPFHHYRNVYRLDSINALGEIEINLPYNLFREKILNLTIDDAMLQVQKPMIIDGDIGFNAEEHEVEPGAIWTVRGLRGGKLQDHVMPLPFGGGITQQVQSVIQMVENSRISVTSDDTTALYSNPNQLATQTMAKMKSLNKSIDGATKRNIYDTEYYLMNQIASIIKNELSEPYKDGKETKFHKINIKGYDVVQEDNESEVKFSEGYGASGSFTLNPKVSEDFDADEIEIIPATKDEELKRDLTEKMTQFLQTFFQTVGILAQSNPKMLEDLLSDMNLTELIKLQLRNLGVEDEMKNVFPIVVKERFQLDQIDAEHEQIMAGVTPEIREEENSVEEFSKHQAFSKGTFFKDNTNKEAKKAMQEHLILTAENAQLQIEMPIADREKGMEGTKEPSQQLGMEGADPMVGAGAPEGGAAPPIPPSQGQVEQGVSSGAAQPV